METQTKQSGYQVVSFVTGFGGGTAKHVMKAGLTKEEAESYLQKMNPKLESEDWLIEEVPKDRVSESQHRM